MIKAKDGYWYAYGTSDPLREGEGEYHLLPMARSDDLVNWEYVGDAFDETTAPKWMAVPEMWAPDIRYLDGRYHLYYVVTDTTESDHEFDNAIGVATAPTPTGPWTDSGAPLVGPRPGAEGDYLWTFDPSQFTDKDGTKYLYFGSYYGGIFVTKLSRNGLEKVGRFTMVAIDNRYEGGYVVRHGRYYYLFASSGDCCAGPTTGYTVFVGRATNPLGPFVDRAGIPLTASRVGGTTVVSPNGNKWVGTGHNSIVTDLSGRDWFVYHAIDRDDAFLDEPFGVNERPMLIDRLDWIDGWPTVRHGKWASDFAHRGPVTRWTVGDEFNAEPAEGTWDGLGRRWTLTVDPAGGYVTQRNASCERSLLTSVQQVSGRLRVEADLRVRRGGGDGAAGVVASLQSPDDYFVAWLDKGAGALVSEVVVGGETARRVETPLHENFRYQTWHNVALEMAGETARIEVTDARLGDPVARQRVALLGPTNGSIGVASRCARVDADNVGAAKLHHQKKTLVPVPNVGPVDRTYSDEFDDRSLYPAWSWVRQPAGSERDGVYRWRTQDADLFKEDNTASVMLRDAPPGDYTVDTKLKIDLGVETERNYQQAGLVAYVHDDLHLRVNHVAIWNTRQTEFAKEMPFADGISYGSMAVGPPTRVTWLRLSHRIDPANGEHEFRAASSRNGRDWVWGGVWTLPAEPAPRIGLVSMGGAGATVEFRYFRVHRP
jgi:arabinan endo-1,5-alpha-L-arabinosidase